MTKGALALLLGSLLAGCTLVIGEIPLPPSQRSPDRAILPPRDARPDDEVPPSDDGVVADLGLDLDATEPPPPPDGGADDVAVPTDIGVAVDGPAPPTDAPVPTDGPGPDGPPTPGIDIGALAGTWDLYGVSVSRVGVRRVFEGRLAIDADGGGRLTDMGGTAVADPVMELRPDPNDPRLVRVDLRPLGEEVVRGMLDAVTGLGVLSARDGPTFAVAARADEIRAPIPAQAAYVHAWVLLDPDSGELGLMTLGGEADVFQERDRHTVSGESPPARNVRREDAEPDRHRLALEDTTDDRLVSAVGGYAAFGLLRREEAPAGLVALWDLDHEPLAQPRLGRMHCASVTVRDGNLAVRQLGVVLDDGGGLSFDNGSEGQLRRLPGINEVSGAGALLGVDQGIALTDPRERIHLFVPATLTPPQTEWGLGLCVPVD